jgi:surfactin synthase thioesterase subunit
VFCIPYAGCGAGLYWRWPHERDGVEFLPVELPGRETRLAEPVAGTFRDLADAMIDGLEPYLGVPFAFFGHCWSALSAYEVCVRLQARGGPLPARLFVSAQVAPQDGPVGRMLGMDEAEMAGEIEATIRTLGGQPHPGLVALYVEVLRADVDTSRRYVVPDPTRLSCPITAIGWTGDEEVRPGRMSGWAECGDTTFEVFDGPHRRFISAPVELLAALSSGVRAR